MPTKPPPRGGKRQVGRRRRDDDEYGGYGGREQRLIKPPDQEKLSEPQLREEIQRVLTTTDPTVIKDRVIWDFKEREFLVVPTQDETITLFHMDAELIPKDQVEEFKKVYPYPLIDVQVDYIDIKDEKEPETEETETTAPSTAAIPDATSAAGTTAPGTTSVPVLGTAESKPSATTTISTTATTAPATAARPATSAVAASAETCDAPEGETCDVCECDEIPLDGEEKKPADMKIVEEDEDEKDEPKETSRQSKFLNQFDFSDRSTQTYNQPLREHASQTQPPPRSSYKDYCNAWIIYDAYENDAENRAKELMTEEKPEEELPEACTCEEPKEDDQKPEDICKEPKDNEREKVRMRKSSVLEGQAAQEAALNKSAEGLKILERLVMQNVHNEVLYDFKYYEDASDEFRETGEGTLLPLWKFSYDRTKRLHVTSISWSQSEPDVFAVSYGSFSFTHPITDGMVLIWSIRNPAFPEQIWVSPRGCMCCAIHPAESSLIAVGMYDGNVALIQLQPDEDNAPSSVVLKNVHVIQKHRSPIWSVKWGEDNMDIDGQPNFYSCGLDGRILHWRIDTSDSNGIGGLGGTEICTLHLPVPPVSGPDGTTYKLFGCARVIAFHPMEKTTFLVGTAEGNIFRCSSLYGSRFQQIYNAHFLPVAALEWNYYHKDVFISCSEDWTIKIWEKKDPEPMYIFEIGVAILDCCWSPYSSTVFAAVTEEGKALVYDLNVNKEKPICCQQIVTKKKVRPHRVQFNPQYPVLIIGDDRGQLTTLKLSPNLRILPKDGRGVPIEGEQKESFEVGKMTKLLSLVRDPQTMTNPKSLARPDEKQVKIVLSAMSGANRKSGKPSEKEIEK